MASFYCLNYCKKMICPNWKVTFLHYQLSHGLRPKIMFKHIQPWFYQTCYLWRKLSFGCVNYHQIMLLEISLALLFFNSYLLLQELSLSLTFYFYLHYSKWIFSSWQYIFFGKLSRFHGWSSILHQRLALASLHPTTRFFFFFFQCLV